MKKTISIIIMLVLLATIIQIMPSVKSFSGAGSGTAEDPYQITNTDELNETIGDLAAYYILMNDIDMVDYGVTSWNGGKGFIPVDYFSGSFDGQNYTISNLFINYLESYKGLFSYVYAGGIVKNLGVASVNITGLEFSGGLIGYNAGTVTNCYSTGNVISTDNKVGGLIGLNGGGTVTNCYSRVNVTAALTFVGGLIGLDESSTVTNCYSTGSVIGGDGFGGLIGHIESSLVTNCYWDTETSGQALSDGGEGRTTAEMTYPYDGYDPPCTGLYETWDLSSYVGNDSIWVHDDLNQNSGYPLLRKNYPAALNSPPNQPTNESPANNSLRADTHLTMSINISDADNDTMNVSFYWGNGILIGNDTGVSSGSEASMIVSNLRYSTDYHWYVVIDDGNGGITRGPASGNWTYTTKNQPKEKTHQSTGIRKNEPAKSENPMDTKNMILSNGAAIVFIVIAILLLVSYLWYRSGKKK